MRLISLLIILITLSASAADAQKYSGTPLYLTSMTYGKDIQFKSIVPIFKLKKNHPQYLQFLKNIDHCLKEKCVLEIEVNPFGMEIQKMRITK